MKRIILALVATAALTACVPAQAASCGLGPTDTFTRCK